MAWGVLGLTVVYAVAMLTMPLAVVLSLLVMWGGIGFVLAVGCLWAVGVLSGSV
jgi:hypothetical protein